MMVLRSAKILEYLNKICVDIDRTSKHINNCKDFHIVIRAECEDTFAYPKQHTHTHTRMDFCFVDETTH